MRTLILLSLLVAGTAGAADSQCVAQSAAQRTHLVALYTSEGCSSCPPADHWLRGIQASDAVVPLEFHVDYWDSLGWKDRFDDPRFTARQRQLAARSTRHITYTPEVALDGHEWRSWSHARLPHAGAPAKANLTLHVQPGNPLRASVDTQSADTAHRRVYIAVTENGLSSHVRAGENSGVLLKHDHTVRAFSGPLPLDDAHASLQLPDDLDRSRSAVVAFVQNTQTGDVAQVVRQPLARCGP